MKFWCWLAFAALIPATAAGISAQTRPHEASAATPARAQDAAKVIGNIQHGAYLAEHVAMCIECHSGRDPQGNIIPAERFMGASIPFRPPWANDWATRAPRNKGLPGYTDEYAIRLLTHGAIDREGRQLRPPMPPFRMTTQDAADVVAYLKSLR